MTLLVTAWNSKLFAPAPDTYVKVMVVLTAPRGDIMYPFLHGGTEEVELASETVEQLVEILSCGHADLDNGGPFWKHPRYIRTLNDDGVVIHGEGFGCNRNYGKKYKCRK